MSALMKFQIPNPKFQRSSKSQVPNGVRRHWDLELGTSLGFGIWNFGFSSHEF